MSDGDELCGVCVKVDLFLLFSGPRYFPDKGFAHRGLIVRLGTLLEVKTNAMCPLCRLVKHDLYGHGISHPWAFYGEECDPSKVRCSLQPVRIDYGEDTEYLNDKTKELLATRLAVYLFADPGCSDEELDLISRHHRGPGIQMLSPDSVDSARPLLNGFRATTMENNLSLLCKWINTCHEHHQETCQVEEFPTPDVDRRPDWIRVINVQERRLVNHDLSTIKYAALSYVSGQTREDITKHTNGLLVEKDMLGKQSVLLPAAVPKVIEDALHVCKALSIPYLWVDLYCIAQNDPLRKAVEINAMGYVYRHSHVTIVAGSRTTAEDGDGVEGEQSRHKGLMLGSSADDLGSTQRIELISNRRYISALPSIIDQIHRSGWSTRGWTYQEGKMARRLAFFGGHDISFICGAGHWREAFHSGMFGHDAIISGVDLRSKGYYTVAALSWLRTAEWDFAEYASILLAYSQRKLSYESDRLDAIAGCLKILGQRKGIQFLSGLPSIDFHYALLWEGEYDRPRRGFPSWSWAGWHAMQQSYWIYPREGISGSLMLAENGIYEYGDQSAPDIELQGVLIRLGMEHPHRPNKCSQQLACIGVSRSYSVITIKSEVARFSMDIIAADSTTRPNSVEPSAKGYIAPNLDTTKGQSSAMWDPEVEYDIPYGRIRLQAFSGNTCEERVYWHQHWPIVRLSLPRTLRGSTLTWLLRDGIELISIAKVKLLEGAQELKPFHHVLCLGLNRSESAEGRGQRMGMFCLPIEVWNEAGPKQMTVELW